MSDMLDALRNAGNDVDGAVARFMGNEAMYTKFLGKLADDDSFDKLQAAFVDGDVKECFAASHTLKGVLGNLGLTKLVELNTPIVETARGGSMPQDADVDAFTAAYLQTLEILKD